MGEEEGLEIGGEFGFSAIGNGDTLQFRSRRMAESK